MDANALQDAERCNPPGEKVLTRLKNNLLSARRLTKMLGFLVLHKMVFCDSETGVLTPLNAKAVFSNKAKYSLSQRPSLSCPTARGKFAVDAKNAH